jgi:hypothetical protein
MFRIMSYIMWPRLRQGGYRGIRSLLRGLRQIPERTGENIFAITINSNQSKALTWGEEPHELQPCHWRVHDYSNERRQRAQ